MKARPCLKTIAALGLAVLIGSGALPLASAGTLPSGSSIAQAQPRSAPKPWNVNLGYKLYSDLKDPSEADFRLVSSFSLAPGWQLSERLKLSFLAIVNQDHRQNLATTLDDMLLSAHYKLPLATSKLKLGSRLSLIIPGTRTAQSADSLYLGTKAAVRLEPSFPEWRVPVSVFYDLSFTQLFHEYETDASGDLNTARRLTHWLSLDVLFSDRLRLNLSGILHSGWSYAGAVKNSFSVDEELSFDLTPKLSLAIGHSRSGNALRANGKDSNFSLFSSRSSQVYAGASYSL